MNNKFKKYLYFACCVLFVYSLHAQEQYIYWTDSIDETIYRGTVDGTHYEPIVVSNSKTPFDVYDGILYFRDYRSSSIQCQSLNSDSAKTILSGVQDVKKIIFEPIQQKIYWNESGEGKIRCVNLDGTGVTDLVVGIAGIQDFAVDVIGEHIYWASSVNEKIQRAKLNGSEIEDVISVTSRINVIDVDGLRGKIYWTDEPARPAPDIKRANLDGSEIETILSGYNTSTILIDSENEKIYLADYRIMRVNLDGSGFEVLASLYIMGISNFTLDTSEGKMYWGESQSFSFYRANLDGSNIENVILNIMQMSSIAVDPNNKHLYWVDYMNIYRADYDGTNIDYVGHVTDGVWGLSDIALDMNNRMIYWILDSDWLSMGIGRTPMDTLDIDYSLTSYIVYAFSLTIDSHNNTLFWLRRYNNNRQITRLNLTNYEREKVVEHRHSPFDLTLDLKNQKIYWTEDADTGAIHRCNFDGSNIETVLSDLDWPRGIALDVAGGKMYWTEKEAGKIKRANLNGTEVEELFSGLSAPTRIAMTFENDGWTAVEERQNEDVGNPALFSLGQNYPNPFNPRTQIEYSLGERQHVKLDVFSMLGQHVATLVDARQNAGSYKIQFNAGSLSSGVYIYRLTTDRFTKQKKMIYLK